jgi:predicted DNA-binding transcriptional regulator YafY
MGRCGNKHAINRMLRLVLLLMSEEGGVTPERISFELNIRIRTVYRYFRTLEDAGLHLTSEGCPKRWRVLFADEWSRFKRVRLRKVKC